MSAESDAVPYIELKGGARTVPVQTIVDVIVSMPLASDYNVVEQSKIPGLRPDDVQSVRGYIHRFGPDAKAPLAIEQHAARTLLLDENIPQSEMLSLSDAFGWATHVAAEGLAGRNTPDRDILEFGRQHAFSFLVTRDRDFVPMYRNLDDVPENGRVPILLFLPENISAEGLSGVFCRHKTRLQRALDNRSKCAFSLHKIEGLAPMF